MATAGNKSAANADAYSKDSSTVLSRSSETSAIIRQAAESLLSSALINLPHGVISFTLRLKIDQTAVLAQSKLLVRSSVLNPPIPSAKGGRQQSSMIPFLARQFSHDADAESLLRPRMPPVQSSVVDQNNGLLEEADERENDVEGSPNQSPKLAPVRLKGPTLVTSEDRDEEMRTLQIMGHASTNEAERIAPAFAIPPQAALLSQESKKQDPVSEDAATSIQEVTKRPLEYDNEYPSKRICNDDLDTTSLPREGTEMPIENPNSPPAKGPNFEDSSLTMNKIETEMDDDDSDDSSIPEIDFTMPSEDEEEDEE
ncbi:MAG: hypothetical protein Q9220_002282 [cf. Caloplaca sp. 1 TL-2023]